MGTKTGCGEIGGNEVDGTGQEKAAGNKAAVTKTPTKNTATCLVPASSVSVEDVVSNGYLCAG